MNQSSEWNDLEFLVASFVSLCFEKNQIPVGISQDFFGVTFTKNQVLESWNLRCVFPVFGKGPQSIVETGSPKFGGIGRSHDLNPRSRFGKDDESGTLW